MSFDHHRADNSVGSVWTLLYDIFVKDDTYLAFLPLAHILEFVVENSFIFAGMPIGYGRVKTLTDASVRECKGDLTEFKPVSWRAFVEKARTDEAEYHDWCPCRLGTNPKGYLDQGRPIWRSQEIGLQLGRQCKAGRPELPYPPRGWLDGCCRLQAGQDADWRKTAIRLQWWWKSLTFHSAILADCRR